jgi:hypothetical protein
VRSIGRYVFVIGIFAVLASAVWVPVAWSEADVTCTDAGLCVNVAKQSRRSIPANRSGGSSARFRSDGRDDETRRVRETIKKFSAALAVYDRRLASYNRCIQTFDPSSNKAACGSAPTPPNAPQFPSDTFSGRGNQPIRITAGQAAAIAAARLQLPRIPPGIGPSPDINQWNMAAVGYPLWLWADGPTHVSVRSTHGNGQGQGRHLRQDLV